MDRNFPADDLHTRDLHLRPMCMQAAEGMFTMLSNPESMKYWCDQPITDIDEAIKVLKKDLESDARGDSLCWAVTMDGEEHMIGKCILFQYHQQNQRAEIGYILNHNFWRRGLMKQALQAVIDFAFTTLELHRIEADVDVDNTASLGLLDSLGFKREGLFKDRWRVYDEWQDSVMLALLNPD